MIYVDPNNNYPRFYGDIMLAHKGWNLGDPLPSGWTLVTETEPPSFNEDEVLEEIAPELVNGQMVQSWLVRPMTESEIEQKMAPIIAKQKLLDAGLTELEIFALKRAI